jgi:hypothetical protein
VLRLRYRCPITIAGIRDQDARNDRSRSPESPIRMPGNRRSPSPGIGDHDRPEYAEADEQRFRAPVLVRDQQLDSTESTPAQLAQKLRPDLLALLRADRAPRRRRWPPEPIPWAPARRRSQRRGPSVRPRRSRLGRGTGPARRRVIAAVPRPASRTDPFGPGRFRAREAVDHSAWLEVSCERRLTTAMLPTARVRVSVPRARPAEEGTAADESPMPGACGSQISVALGAGRPPHPAQSPRTRGLSPTRSTLRSTSRPSGGVIHTGPSPIHGTGT